MDASSPTSGEGDSNSIRVVIRCRPLNAKEKAEGGTAEPGVVCSDKDIQGKGPAGKRFSFDRVFGCSATQEEVFDELGVHLLENAMNAYNGCIFAYGQTGSGKSHSVVGDVRNEGEKGILPRACTRLFELMAAKSEQNPQFQATVFASYLEIYNEKLFDLLASGKDPKAELQVRSHPTLGAIVANLTECPIKNFMDALELLDFGVKRRAVGSTQMNATSSRSHAVFTVQLRMAVASAGGAVDSQAKLHFVDLAGSERQKKTGAAGSRLKEGIGINQSLSTLGRVISELTKPGVGKKTPAFRDSKLTMLLKDALMGNSRTELLACVSPAQSNLEETLSTLEFAARCKLVKTTARKNEQSKVDMISKLIAEKAEIEVMLRQERDKSEVLIHQLTQRLDEAAQKQREAEDTLGEKRRLEEDLQKLQALANEAGADGDSRPRAGSGHAKVPEPGDRVVVSAKCTGGRGRLVGTIRFFGETHFSEGHWVGLALDDPKGKNNGMVNGKQYFECEPSHGLFVRPWGICATEDMEEDQGPGEYRLVAPARVTATPATSSSHVATLRRGMFVNVAEVLRLDDEHLIRGRLEEPVAGWISLSSTQDEKHWVIRETVAATEDVKKHRAAINELHLRLAEIEKEEEQRHREREEEMELRARLEGERRMQEGRQQDMLAQIEALKGVQASYALDQADIEATRERLQKQREKELAKLGMHFMDIAFEDMPMAPKLVNLHPDPALKGCLVYFLPLGETRIGSNADRCRVALTGLNIAAEVCAIINENNRRLLLEPCMDGLVRVNGRSTGEEGCELKDGDRVAIGRGYIFQVQVPATEGEEGAADGRSRARADSDEFDQAMEEIAEFTGVDPSFQSGIEKAMMLVKSDFGPEAANHLLTLAKKASEACIMANGVLRQMPERLRGRVVVFELSVLFDAHGLPEVCVVARREPVAFGEDASPVSTSSVSQTASPSRMAAERRTMGPCAGIWEVEHFWQERLPAMFEALSDIGFGGSAMPRDTCEESGVGGWETRVWGEVPIDDYRQLCLQNEQLAQQLRASNALLEQYEQGAGGDSSGRSRLALGYAAGAVLGGVKQAPTAATDWITRKGAGARRQLLGSGSKLIPGLISPVRKPSRQSSKDSKDSPEGSPDDSSCRKDRFRS